MILINVLTTELEQIDAYLSTLERKRNLLSKQKYDYIKGHLVVQK